MDTVPGVARALATGLNMKVEPYADGDAGIRKSLEEMARIMREARHDTSLMGWAIDVLKSKGLDGRNRPGPGIRAQAEALLNALREKTIYKPDPSGSEWIQAPHVTLCLRDLCIPAEDCDGLTTCLGGAMLSIGLPAYIVKQNFGPNHQQHVLVGLVDEKGKKWYADPSTNKPITSSSSAVEEIWLDPLDQVGHTGVSGAEIVTLGKPGEHCCSSCEAGGECNGLAKTQAEPCCSSCANGGECEGLAGTKTRETFFKDGRWFEFSQGSWFVFDQGRWWKVIGNGTLIEAGLGYGFGDPIDFTPLDISQNRNIIEGLRYRFEVEFSFKGDPSQYDYLPAMAREEIGQGFVIESFTAKGPATKQDVPGSWLDRLGKWAIGEELWIQRFEVIGLAKKTGNLSDDSDARVPYRILNLAIQAANPNQPISPASGGITKAPSNAAANFGLGNTLIAAVGIGSLVGIAYFMLKSKGK